MKVGDLVEFMDQSCMRDESGNYLYNPSGIYGIIIGRDVTQMFTTRWYDGQTSSDPDHRLRLVSEAKEN
tara:strand:- start:554 stop:760 length:207 start_codon:yes stop_codon:yes gene_type:complete